MTKTTNPIRHAASDVQRYPLSRGDLRLLLDALRCFAYSEDGRKRLAHEAELHMKLLTAHDFGYFSINDDLPDFEADERLDYLLADAMNYQRVRQGFSVDGLARRADLPADKVASVLRGETRFTILRAQLIAGALGTTPGRLLDEVGDALNARYNPTQPVSRAL